jgi:glycosyltransferase involved in cell wall biosynthesis
MRILHVITTLDVGGAEMHLLQQVRGQCARGHGVRIAWLKGAGRLAADFEEAGAVAVGRVGPLALVGELRRAELVHSHLLKADALTAVCAKLSGCAARLVSGKHNDERALLKPWVSRIHGVLGNVPLRTIALSDHVRRFVEEHGRVKPERMRRVYYGIDASPFEDASEQRAMHRAAVRAEFGFGADDIVFVCVARFAPQKAHDVLLEAFARARAAVAPELQPRMLLVGDDPFGDGRERAELWAKERELGEDCVVFCGIRRDVPRLMAASDVFVMSSLWEGLGLVFIEAMATGLPVLGSEVSAVPEVVTDGVTGVLVPPGDAAALAEGMERLIRDAELRARLSTAGPGIVRERFSLDRMVEETLAIYEEVLAA